MHARKIVGKVQVDVLISVVAHLMEVVVQWVLLQDVSFNRIF